ncbi:hypothetical protein HOP50_18g81610 [Chloropicon primus]|uniref:AP2/ERF domain-containing protein n=1 Tax=Chloropicon primus TaxID=1764295 RepID=A0A5B8MYK0_9CHLO|nr:hypothetical protein A3770_18p81370 [Chloropicon primus]UPR04816.1 hypothetical protein HOP50_18g81610 [Chloropicon primus]|eukprot:QDZ25619.1 hypothetical protein A3770_18p81370 [Chloropicon primus]
MMLKAMPPPEVPGPPPSPVVEGEAGTLTAVGESSDGMKPLPVAAAFGDVVDDVVTSPRSITHLISGKSLTPNGSPDVTPPNSRNSSFRLDRQPSHDKSGGSDLSNGGSLPVKRERSSAIGPGDDFLDDEERLEAELSHLPSRSAAEETRAMMRRLQETEDLGGSKCPASPGTPLAGRTSKNPLHVTYNHKGQKKVTGVRGVHQMGERYGRRFQVRVWLRRGQFKEKEYNYNAAGQPVDPDTNLPVAKKVLTGGGKRIHLGCFSHVKTATKAFDIAEIFFRGDAAQTNLPITTYSDNPVLFFLLHIVQDRNSLEEFMTVWKHIMPYKWIIDADKPTEEVVAQLEVIKESLAAYHNKAQRYAERMGYQQHQLQQQQQVLQMNLFLEENQSPFQQHTPSSTFLATEDEMTQLLETTNKLINGLPEADQYEPQEAVGLKRKLNELTASQIASVVDATNFSASQLDLAAYGGQYMQQQQQQQYQSPSVRGIQADSSLYNTVAALENHLMGDQQFSPPSLN